MSFDTYQGVLSSGLAGAGTLTLAYKANRSKGNYSGAAGHKVVFGGNNAWTAPTAFQVTFGTNAAGITFTWGSGQNTIPEGTRYTIELNRAGIDDKGGLPAADTPRLIPASLVRIDLGSPNVLDTDGISASQSVSAGASFLLNGALIDDFVTGRMILDVPRNVVAAWTTTSILTITGKDEFGETMVEVSASGTSHTGKKAFKEITSVSSSASITSATVGTGDVLGLPVFVPAAANILIEAADGVVKTSTRSAVTLQGVQSEANVDAGTSLYLVSPFAGIIRSAYAVPDATVTTGGDITLAIATVAVAGITVTVGNGATAGTVSSDTAPTLASATAVVAAGDAIEVIFPAAFNASADIHVAVVIEPTVTLDGTLVVGNASAAQSGTSADVRGTYDPYIACDGTTGFVLIAQLTNPNYRGEAQYDG
jgi:hypothetical protein